MEGKQSHKVKVQKTLRSFNKMPKHFVWLSWKAEIQGFTTSNAESLPKCKNSSTCTSKLYLTRARVLSYFSDFDCTTTRCFLKYFILFFSQTATRMNILYPLHNQWITDKNHWAISPTCAAVKLPTDISLWCSCHSSGSEQCRHVEGGQWNSVFNSFYLSSPILYIPMHARRKSMICEVAEMWNVGKDFSKGSSVMCWDEDSVLVTFQI